MKKQSSILLFALSLFFFSVVAGSNAQAQKAAKSDVSVSRSISAGQYAADGKPMVVVTITINKYAYSGPGRIEENFSSDFQAVLLSGGRASFQSSSGKAEFIWNNIPEDRVITVSYALEALGKTSESQTVSGQFFYQNQTFDIDPNPTSFTLDVSNLPAYKPAVDPTNTSSLDDLFHSVTGNYPPDVTPPPVNNAPEQAPSNVVSTANSNQPVQQQMPTTAPAQQSAPEITAPAQQSAPEITAPAQQSAPMTTTTAPAQQSAPETTAPAQQSAPENTAPAQQSAPETTAPAQQSAPENTTAPETASSASNMTNQGDLVYRVQIIVVGDKSKLPRFLRQYRITDEVYYDPANDTPVRVMVGNYSDYNSAKARCNELKSRGLAGAFIAPYYMGKRISMAEAASHSQH